MTSVHSILQDSDDSHSGSDTDEYEVPASMLRPTTSSRKRYTKGVQKKAVGGRKQPTARTWQSRDIPHENSDKFMWIPPNMDTSKYPQTPTGLFNLFFDDDVIGMIVEQSIKYASTKGNHTFTTSKEEIRVFIAILLVSGYNTIPRRRMYWSLDTDVRNETIADAMTRDRFDTIMRFIHIADNTLLDTDDKFSKVRPLLAMLNERFLLYFLKEKNLSIDESMIPYYGRHGAKQFIRGKPIRFGYKMWALTTSLGYVLQFEPYQGARGRQSSDNLNLGMGGAVVMDLLSELRKDNAYHITFDNLFASLRLVDELTKMNISCTGTIRSNRIENCPVKPTHEMSKTARGTFDQSFDVTNGLVVVRWNDNNIVNVVSNVHGIEPIQTASRWSRTERARIRIPQPFAIRHYNQTMGGVDRMDQNIAKYRISIRSKKWWWPVFAYCIDLSVQQVWHLYRATDANKQLPLDLLGIRRAIVTVFLAQGRRNVNLGRPIGRPKTLSQRVPDEVRLDGLNHYAHPNKEARCALCKDKCKTKCTKCDIALHRKCFEPFHT